MAEKSPMEKVQAVVEKLPQVESSEAQLKSKVPSAGSLEPYADEGLVEHKSGHHLEEHWHKGYGGLRNESLSDEEERLHEKEAKFAGGQPGVAARAKAALTAAGEKLAPGPVKPSRSAAELAYSQAEGYADEGFAEHKSGKHLEEYWHKGYGGLRDESLSDEEDRLHENQNKSQAGVVARAKEAAVSTAAAATEKASEMLQAAKEMVGMGPEK